MCVNKILEKANTVSHNPNDITPQEKVLYEQVGPLSHAVTKDGLELQPNPAYSVSPKVIMDANPAYESCK